MLEQLTATQFQEWAVWYRIEMPGQDRADYWAAQQCTLQARAHFKGDFKPADFVPDLRSQDEKDLAAAQAELARAQFAAMQQQAIDAAEAIKRAGEAPEPEAD